MRLTSANGFLSVAVLSPLLLCGVASALVDVTVEDGIFHDSSRDRDVPYLLYRPAEPEGRYPVIVFSHGLGGSRRGASYLGEHLAANGYVAFHVQHAGSDESVWIGAEGGLEALVESLRDPGNALERFLDVPFVLDEIEKLDTLPGPLRGHLDTEHVGMAGHSYGARSTMIAAGERVGRRYLSFKESRIDAGVALSPNLPRLELDLERAYADVSIPLLHVTGTLDGNPLPGEEDMDPSERTEPFENMEESDQYLLVLDGADHMTFSGHRLGKPWERDGEVRHIEAVKTVVLAFFDAYLKGDENALAFLRDGFQVTLESGDDYRWKEKED